MMQQPMGMMAPLPQTADGGMPMAKPHLMGRGLVTQPHAQAHPQSATQPQAAPPPGALSKEVADDKPAMLSEGELVVPADEVRWHGLKTFMKMKADAKKGLMNMHAAGQIQTTDDAKQHPATQPAHMNRGGYMGVHPKAQEIPAYADGGVVGNGSNNVYNAYLQTGGQTTPKIQGFLNPQGNFDFGYTNTAGGMVNPTSGTGGSGGLTPSPTPTPTGGFMQPAATSDSTGTSMLPTTQAQQTNGAAESAAASQPGQQLSTSLTPDSMMGGGSGSGGGARSAGGAGGTSGGPFDTQNLVSDAKSVAKFVTNQIQNPDSFLNTHILSSSESNLPQAPADIVGNEQMDAALNAQANGAFGEASTSMAGGDATLGIGVDPVAATAGDVTAEGAASSTSAAGATASAGAGVGTGLMTAGAGIAGTFLGTAIGGNNQTNAGIGGAVGGTIGGAAGGAMLGSELGMWAGPVGAFAGAALGSLLGSFLGPQHGTVGPNGQADVQFDPTTNSFKMTKSAVDNGGNHPLIENLGNQYASNVNTVLSKIGGKVDTSSMPTYTIGYLKGNYFVNGQSYATQNQALTAAVKSTIANTKIDGGNPYVLAAITNGNPGDIPTLDANLTTAVNYQSYLAHQASIDTLIKSSPKNPLAAKWQSTITQAKSLGLDQVKAA